MDVTGLKERLEEIRSRELENGRSVAYINELDYKLQALYNLHTKDTEEEMTDLNFIDYFIWKELDDIRKDLINKAREASKKRQERNV